MFRKLFSLAQGIGPSGQRWLHGALGSAVLLALSYYQVPAAFGQQAVLGTATERGATLPNGFHLDSVDVSGSYSSFAGPVQSASISPLTLQGFAASASLPVSYLHRSPFSNFSVNYTPTYTNLFRYSQHYFGHAVAVSLNSRFGSQWALTLSGAGNLSEVEQFLFLPQRSIDISAPGTTDVGYTPTLLAASQGLLFGTRILDLEARARVTYSPSKRLRFSVEGQGGQILARPEQGVPDQSVIPRARLAGGVLSVDYNVSPQTSVGADGYFQEGWTALGSYQTATVGMHLARKIDRHWSVSGFGGYSLTSSVGGAPLSDTGSLSASVKIGYQARQSTWIAGYFRQGGDAYGLGSTATAGYSTSWDWHSLNRGWGVSVTGDRSQSTGGTESGIDFWDATFTVSRGLGRQAALGVGGSYLRERLGTALPGDATVYSARVIFSWIPFLRDTMPLRDVSNQSDQTPSVVPKGTP